MILDSVYFPSGGGSSVKKYTVGMTAENLDQVRSVVDSLPYTRWSTTPTLLTLTKDPANDPNNFVVDDPANPIGSVRAFADNDIPSLRIINGQVWQKSGVYSAPSALVRAIPETIKNHGDLCTHNLTAPWASAVVWDAVGDGNGKWMVVTNDGKIWRTSNDGVLFTQATALTTTANARLATNKKGRWWLCTNVGTILLSENFGDSWTQVSTNPEGGSVAPAVFKYMCGRLWFASNTTNKIFSVNTANAVNTNTYFWLPDSSSTTQAWTALSVPTGTQTNGAYTKFAANINMTPVEAVGNDVSKIWFVCYGTNGYMLITIYDISDNSYLFASFGASYYIHGVSYDPLGDGNMYFSTWPYTQSGYNVPSYEVVVTPTGVVSSTANAFKNPSQSYDSGDYTQRRSGYLRRGSYSMGWVYNGGNAPSNMGGIRNNTSALGVQRNPVGHTTLGQYTYLFLAEAGGTVLWLSNPYYSRCVAGVGITAIVNPNTGMLNYIRIQ